MSHSPPPPIGSDVWVYKYCGWQAYLSLLNHAHRNRRAGALWSSHTPLAYIYRMPMHLFLHHTWSFGTVVVVFVIWRALLRNALHTQPPTSLCPYEHVDEWQTTVSSHILSVHLHQHWTVILRTRVMINQPARIFVWSHETDIPYRFLIHSYYMSVRYLPRRQLHQNILC